MLKRNNYTDFSKGMNVLDSAHFIDDNNIVAGVNVDLIRGGIRARSGTSLFNNDTAKSGGIKAMHAYYKSDGTKQMVFANGSDWYYLLAGDATDKTWRTVGSYGTETDNPRGYTYDNKCVLGSGGTNVSKLWDGSDLDDITDPPAGVYLNIFEKIQGGDVASLFAAQEGTSTLYWSKTTDPDDWNDATAGSVVIGKDDGEQIRGLKAQGTTLWVFKDTRKYPVRVEYDQATSAWLPLVKPNVDQSGGTMGHDSIKVVTMKNKGDDLHYLAHKGEGVQSFGRNANFGDSPLGVSVSELINPILNQINWDKANISRAIVWKRKYMLAYPSQGSTFNNRVFVRNLDTGGWTIYKNWNVGAWCIFKDSDGIDQLYYGDSITPNIYIVKGNVYSDDNGEYPRSVLTKKYTMQKDFSLYNAFHYIDIFGYITSATNLYITIYVDDKSRARYKIDKSFIIGADFASYLGDTHLGTEVFGGGTIEQNESLFFARLPISDDLRIGKFLQLLIENSGNGQSWQLNGIEPIYEPQPFEYFPDQYIVKTIS